MMDYKEIYRRNTPCPLPGLTCDLCASCNRVQFAICSDFAQDTTMELIETVDDWERNGGDYPLEATLQRKYIITRR
jgi:hypothetical protein